MKKYYADNNSIKFLRVFSAMIIICIIIAIYYNLYYINGDSKIIRIIGLTMIVALITAYVVMMLIILPMWYKSVSYTVAADEIIIRSGVAFKNTTYIKISSIQYTATIKCPFSDKTSFNFLLINAYGGRAMLLFLSSKSLEEINKKIQTYLRERGGL
ncbi:MAG: PH domain-containing protein [Oscillospiraceae bacterium]|nr:PH domain-containing protein [Oscillospiraceae bacterium]